jgi:hypothetical protein
MLLKASEKKGSRANFFSQDTVKYVWHIFFYSIFCFVMVLKSQPQNQKILQGQSFEEIIRGISFEWDVYYQKDSESGDFIIYFKKIVI